MPFFTYSKVSALRIFTLFYIIAMFLPRLVVKGMFGDGLLYASMARNMAIGKGSMWQPFFSSSYWLDNVAPIYYENPPLMLWLESLFFTVFGDFWWIEKAYSLFIFTLNCFLIIKIAHFFERKYNIEKGFGWLVLIFWHLIPRVLWANPNNMMDNNLLTFCLLSVLFILHFTTLETTKSHTKSLNSRTFLTHSRVFYLLLSVLSIFLGILTKGPVALYPLSIPLLFAFFTHNLSYKKAFYDTIFLTSLSVLFFILFIYFNTNAKIYFINYWEQRLLAVIVGSRDDMKLNGWERLEIVFTLLTELLPIIAVFLIGFISVKIKKIRVIFNKRHINTAFFFLFLGLCGSLPIIVSTKQSGIYLIPSFPMFAFSAGFFALPFYEKYIHSIRSNNFSKGLHVFSRIALSLTFIYTAFITGGDGRDAALLKDVDILRHTIPIDEKVGVCSDMMHDFTFHTNLQRFCRYELKQNTPTTFFLTRKHVCDSLHQDSLTQIGYKRVYIPTHYFSIYKK